MEDNTIKYSIMTKIQLVSLCKERNIRGYASRDSTKEIQTNGIDIKVIANIEKYNINVYVLNVISPQK